MTTRAAKQQTSLTAESGWGYLRVQHELAGAAAFAMCHELERLARSGATGVFLDLGQVSVIDASGVVALVRVYSGFTHHGVALRVIGSSAEIRSRLEAVGLARVVDMEELPEPVALALSVATS